MQPHFAPWLGYFYLIIKSDKFIILDNVQFDKRSWQQRNLISNSNKSEWLTIPVMSKGKFAQKINQVKVDYNSDFIRKHLSKIFHNYNNHKYFDSVYSILEKIYTKKYEYLIDLNLDLLNEICSYLKFSFNYELASDLDIRGSKADLIYNIINYYNEISYISPLGSKSYIENSKLFKDLDVKYIKYKPIDYTEKNKFLSNLSIIDLLFHKGPNGLNYIEKSFYLD